MMIMKIIIENISIFLETQITWAQNFLDGLIKDL